MVRSDRDLARERRVGDRTGSGDQFRSHVAGGICEVGPSKGEVCLAGRFTGNWKSALGDERDQSTDIEIIEVRVDYRRAVFSERDGGVTGRAAVECFRHEIVYLNLIAGGHYRGMNWSQLHLA